MAGLQLWSGPQKRPHMCAPPMSPCPSAQSPEEQLSLSLRFSVYPSPINPFWMKPWAPTWDRHTHLCVYTPLIAARDDELVFLAAESYSWLPFSFWTMHTQVFAHLYCPPPTCGSHPPRSAVPLLASLHSPRDMSSGKQAWDFSCL